MCSSRRGFSLLEALLACTLLSLLLTLLIQVLVPMARGSVRGTQQAGLQQITVLAAGQVERDLAATPPAGLALFPAPSPGGPSAASLHRLLDVAADGSPVFATDLVLLWWDPDRRQLGRRRWPPAPPTTAETPTSARCFTPGIGLVNQVLATSNPAEERVLAGDVSLFSLTLAGPLATLRLVCEAAAPDGKPPESFEVRKVIVLRNPSH